MNPTGLLGLIHLDLPRNIQSDPLHSICLWFMNCINCNIVSLSKENNLPPTWVLQFLQKFTVPQSFFTHFYVLGLLWTTALFFTSVGFALTYSRPAPEEHNLSALAAQILDATRSDLLGGGPTGGLGKYGKEAWRLVFLLLLFGIHVTRRLYECLFVSTFDPSARMNFFGYIIALGYSNSHYPYGYQSIWAWANDEVSRQVKFLESVDSSHTRTKMSGHTLVLWSSWVPLHHKLT